MSRTALPPPAASRAGRLRGLARACAPACVLLLAACAGTRATETSGATFVIVRHAEKADDDPRDPTLTPAGQARAERLARMLADAPLTAVYATRFRRTRSTAQPAARAHGLAVVTYDAARAPADIAAQLRANHTRGSVLVVGHSNTAPGLAAALCACDVEPMPESEYGRYYRLTAPASSGAPARLEVLAW